MGQKVSPIGLRIGINKDWESKWYAPNHKFAKNLGNDIKIREYITKNLVDKGISKVEIEKSKNHFEVIIHSSKPGVLIGKGGEEIEKIKKELSKIVNENVFVSIVDIKKPDLDAQLVADSIAKQITNRASFRMVQKRAIKNAMKAGAIWHVVKVILKEQSHFIQLELMLIMHKVKQIQHLVRLELRFGSIKVKYFLQNLKEVSNYGFNSCKSKTQTCT